MRLSAKLLISAIVLACGCAAAGAKAEGAGDARHAGAGHVERYADLLDMHGSPRTPTDRSFNIFFDDGAWQGYSLPPADDPSTGFTGPFVHSLGDGRWVGLRFAELTLHDAARGGAIVPAPTGSHAEPGYLQREFSAPGLTVRETLFFADSAHALVRIELRSTTARNLHVAAEGSVMPGQAGALAVEGDAVTQTFADSHSRLITRLHAEDTVDAEGAADADGAAAADIGLSAAGYRIAPALPLHLAPGRTSTLFLEQTLVYDTRSERPARLDDSTAWARTRARWAGYLRAAAASHLAGVPDAVAQRIAVKAMLTLLGNWRAARGDLHHDGVIPSYSNPDFNGFWAWDSWKHAAALAHFAPALAREQMRAMFDYQAADGMIPDCIFLDKANDNWRDTKPPLATWATLEIYRATGDKAFLVEMYDKLVRYHRWWFAARVHDHDGVPEYGSTDGTAIAAKWESGMDNAVRFDGIVMLKNGRNAWSMNQASVDLSADLYREALDLAQIAGALGKADDRQQWLRQAAVLRSRIRTRMFDEARGYFFDIKLGSGAFVHVYGPEGWMPLWAGAATPSQAGAVARVMLDPNKFATRMPFPTLARDDPRFSPITGYWRGPVWVDQAYFGVEGLRRYGYGRQADAMARRLVFDAKGLTGRAPIYENYDPLTGQGYQSPNFSWSAASYLLLLQHGARARPPGQNR
jgi:putative isomerase